MVIPTPTTLVLNEILRAISFNDLQISLYDLQISFNDRTHKISGTVKMDVIPRLMNERSFSIMRRLNGGSV